MDILPSQYFGQHIPHQQFQLALQFRLGARIAAGTTACPECSNATIDVFASHATECKHGGGVTARHNAVRDTLCQLARTSKRVSNTEERGLLNDGTARKPADVSISNWNLNRKLCVDVSIVTGTATDGISRMEATKKTKYLLKCNEEQMDFRPFVLDSFGRMGEEAWMLLNRLSYKYADACHIPVHEAKRRLRGKIVIAMIKQQSAQIARRVRDGPTG